MYLVLFLDRQEGNYEFNVWLHSSLPKAKAAYETLPQRFAVKRDEWGDLFDYCGEAPHIYRIECDEPAEEIDLATA
jgi:hypothetical protein